LVEALRGLDLSYPKSDTKRLRELKSFRKLLAK
jgi:hypothetical protein